MVIFPDGLILSTAIAHPPRKKNMRFRLTQAVPAFRVKG